MDGETVAAAAHGRSGAASPLLERERELSELDRLVADARSGAPVLALIEGPAGIGKSRLLAAAREKADGAGFRVLGARGSDLERELPFGVVRQLFEPLLVDGERRGRWLSGPAEPAARVFGPPTRDSSDQDASFDILYGLFWLTANIAVEGPLALVIDDLHWCDSASLRFIAYLERRLAGLRVLVGAAARVGDPRADARLTGEIAHDPAAVSIRPGALSEAAVAELARQRLGMVAEPAFAAACQRATGGNPLLLGELLKTLEADGVSPDAAHADVVRDIGPRAVSRTVLLRLARLPADAVAVARAIAVLGDAAGLPATATLAGLDERRVAEATRALVAAEIIAPDPPLDFVHPLVRDAVYHELSPSERELAHETAARALNDLGAAPEIVAAHLLVVPRRGRQWVAARLRDAALAAGRRGATDSAVSYLRRALAEPVAKSERAQLLLELGAAESLLNVPAAAEHMADAHAQLDDPLQRARAAGVLARVLIFTRPPQESVDVVRRAVAELGDAHDDAHDDERRALEAFELFAVAFGADVPDAAPRLAAVRDRGIGNGPGARMLGAVAAWDWAMGGGSAQACAELARAALDGGALIAADPGFMTIVATAVLVLADCDEALTTWDAAMTEARRLGSVFAVCGVDLWRGWTWLQRGELAEAEDSLRRAMEATILADEPDGVSRSYAGAFLSRVRLERGDLHGADAALATGVDPSPGSDADTLTLRSRIELLLARGRWAEALTDAQEYRKRLGSVDNVAWAPWRSLTASALHGLGDRDAALALLDEELAVARRWGAPWALCRTLRLLGTIRDDDGIELLREAVATAEGSPARLEHARALGALGSALRRRRRPSDAREPLREAFEAASRCGAAALAEQVRAELHAAGARPRHDALTGPASLTPSERRVADLAAAGHSNREIAQSLYVTPKTVEVHLTSVYRKLGIGARTELAGELG